MSDPLGELEESLAYMFELQKDAVQGKFINPLVGELKKTIDDYKKNKIDLSALIKALNEAFPIIENYVDSQKVRQKAAAVFMGCKKETLNWQLKKPSVDETDFLSWLSIKFGKNFETLNSDQQVQLLLTAQSDKEFRIKLGVYLHRNSDFLINLALSSESNFIRLLRSRLGFKFEKIQIAKAINHYLEAMRDKSDQPFILLEKLMLLFDHHLAPKGYSIEKLLHDPLVKIELGNLNLIKLQQESFSLKGIDPA